MKIKTIAFVIFTVIAMAMQAQSLYTVIDKDGYTNIREKPTTNSRIIDTAVKYELLFSANYFCGEDIDFSNVPPNWIPVMKNYGTPIGYVYRDNILSFDDMSFIQSKHRNPQESDTLICSNDTLTTLLVLKPFDFDQHTIEYIDDFRGRSIPYIDGEYPKCMAKSEYTKENCLDDREIKELIINIREKRYALPIDVIKGYFNPGGLTVYFGTEGELYISISCGDGGDSYSIMLSVVSGKIMYSTPTEAC